MKDTANGHMSQELEDTQVEIRGYSHLRVSPLLCSLHFTSGSSTVMPIPFLQKLIVEK